MRNMRFLVVALVVLAIAAWGAGQAQAPKPSPAPAPAAKAAPGQLVTGAQAFALMKTLVGEWQGTGTAGDKSLPARFSYGLTGAGSALVETLFPGTPHEMVTVYHLDGPKFMLTHYCAAGNQPSMVLDPSSTGNHLVFVFLRGTNMDPQRDTHMHNARYTFLGADHILAEWDTSQAGKIETKKFDLTRRK